MTDNAISDEISSPSPSNEPIMSPERTYQAAWVTKGLMPPDQAARPLEVVLKGGRISVIGDLSERAEVDKLIRILNMTKEFLQPTPTDGSNHLTKATETVVTSRDEVLFQALVDEWRRERSSVSSSVTELVLVPAYQKIIGMGEKAVPMILGLLRNEGDSPDHWFWALEMITGKNPILQEDEGDMVRMAAAWLAWGDERYARQLEPA